MLVLQVHGPTICLDYLGHNMSKMKIKGKRERERERERARRKAVVYFLAKICELGCLV